MDQSMGAKPDNKQPDISQCRVNRKIVDVEVCMMNTYCPYELPFWNICSHPDAKQIAEGGPELK